MKKATPVSYNPKIIETKWRKIWKKNKTFQVDLNSPSESEGKPYYNLMMFPYPSAEGLHVGNMYAFTGSDIWGRYMKMKGYDVFEPIGLDGFGIHSENYAIKVGKHPAEQAKISEKNFYNQLKQIGCQFSWDNKLETYDPEYYKWTQWIFIQMFKAGLAYRKKSPVNWCPSCKTVLADEQVVKKLKAKSLKLKANIDVCERCETEVVIKDLEQWFFRITKYADRLLNNLKKIDWTEKVKIAQRNWIGRKQGINITYKVVNDKYTSEVTHHKNINNSGSCEVNGLGQFYVTCFTTRPDTNFGAAFVVLAPEHPLVEQITSKDSKKAVSNYIKQALKKSKIERMAEGRDKTGVFTGAYCINQLTQKPMPIWISDFVLMEVGTGAVVGVPGHDLRDFEFARKFGLPIIRVVVGKDNDCSKITKASQVQEKEGKMINSGFLNGMDIHEATKKVMDHIEDKGWGKKTTTYHLRDWLISRQRYWGPPIPMVYCKKCAEKAKRHLVGVHQHSSEVEESEQMFGWFPVPESDLPVKLPYLKDYRPKGTGRGPLAQLKDWVNVKCPKCGAPAQRETDVSDTFLDSAWYFLRYPSINLKSLKNTSEVTHHKNINNSGSCEVEELNKPWDKTLTKKWLPVDMYIGGAEHSVLHLLYSRFLTMVFKDLGYLDFEEPFTKFRAHGLIIKDGAKMSKSKGNVITPDKYIAKYGTDALRCYLMFLGPFSQGGDFRDTGMKGMYKFLAKVYRLCQEKFQNSKIPNLKTDTKDTSERPAADVEPIFEKQKTKGQRDRLATSGNIGIGAWQHKTIKRVTDSISRLKYNTAISALMEYVNYLTSLCHSGANSSSRHSGANSSSRHSGASAIESPSRSALALRFGGLDAESIKTLILLLAPFAPHLSEELWQQISLKNTSEVTHHKNINNSGSCEVEQLEFGSVHNQKWPKYNPKYIKQDKIEVVIQINGKLRDRIEVSSEQSKNKQEIINLALSQPKVQNYLKSAGARQKPRPSIPSRPTAYRDLKIQKYLKDKKIKKTIFIKGKLINFVV